VLHRVSEERKPPTKYKEKERRIKVTEDEEEEVSSY
jgi:hypothetical protein